MGVIAFILPLYTQYFSLSALFDGDLFVWGYKDENGAKSGFDKAVPATISVWAALDLAGRGHRPRRLPRGDAAGDAGARHAGVRRRAVGRRQRRPGPARALDVDHALGHFPRAAASPDASAGNAFGRTSGALHSERVRGPSGAWHREGHRRRRVAPGTEHEAMSRRLPGTWNVAGARAPSDRLRRRRHEGAWHVEDIESRCRTLMATAMSSLVPGTFMTSVSRRRRATPDTQARP